MCKALPYDILILKRQVLSKCCGLEHECEALGGHWGSLGGSLGVLGDPWEGPGGSLEVPKEVPKEVLGDPSGSLGRSLEVLGGPWEGLIGGTKNGGCSRGASWDGPGRPLGCFWRYWAILG